MIGSFRGLRWVAFTWLVVSGPLGMPAAAQETADRRPAAVAPDVPPPFWVAGVVIEPARRLAILVPLDDARRELGIITLHEGQSYDNYRLVTVEPSRVLLDADGTVVSLRVGRPYSGPRAAPEAGGRAATGPIFIPGPDKPRPDLEYTGPQTSRGGGAGATSAGTGEVSPDVELVQGFVERLLSHPHFQQQIEEIRPLIRQKMERARPDGQPPAPGP